MKPLTLSSLIAITGIALGAFGAHGLEPQLEARESVDVWETAVFYHLIHAVALFVVASSDRLSACRWTARLWYVGILLFSGSLYVLSLQSVPFLGPITPLGGLALMAGWLALIFESKKSA